MEGASVAQTIKRNQRLWKFTTLMPISKLAVFSLQR